MLSTRQTTLGNWFFWVTKDHPSQSKKLHSATQDKAIAAAPVVACFGCLQYVCPCLLGTCMNVPLTSIRRGHLRSSVLESALSRYLRHFYRACPRIRLGAPSPYWPNTQLPKLRLSNKNVQDLSSQNHTVVADSQCILRASARGSMLSKFLRAHGESRNGN